MKFLKPIYLLALLPMILVAGCNKDDDPSLMPDVSSSNPLENAIDVATNSSIEITFNKEMDATSINATSFKITEGTNAVAGSITHGNKTATFTPTNDLKSETLYKVLLTTAAKDKQGVSMAGNYSYTFTTGVVIDVTPPTVVSTNPVDNANGVARNKVVAITFNESMSASSFTSASFFLKQGSNTVAGSIGYSNMKATFIPDAILGSNLTYTVTVTTAIKDMANNAIASAKSWTFTTGSEAGLAVVNLRASGNYVVLAKTAITNVPTSAITGDMGLSPAATSFITGYGLVNATGYATSPQVTGKLYAADMAAPTSSNLTTAVENMLTAYSDAAGRLLPDQLNLNGGNIGEETLAPGLYKFTSTVTIPNDVTLSGGADAVWIFQIDNDLTMSADMDIILSGGAQAKNIFWQVAGEAVLGANSHFEGIILSKTGITLQTGASYNGRMLAQTAVILDQNIVVKP